MSDNVNSGYNVPYWWYDIRGFFIFLFCYQDFLPTTIHFFAKNISKKHLEVAVGSGSFFKTCLIWRKLFFNTKDEVGGSAIDYTADMIFGAKKNFKNEPTWEIKQASVFDMPFIDNSFLTINIANAYHCFSDIDLATKELTRVVAKNGEIAINVLTRPNSFYLFEKIANAIVEWGKKNNIVERTIERDEVLEVFTKYGFDLTFEKQSGNNLRMIFKKL